MRPFNNNEKIIIRELLCEIATENIDYFDLILKKKYFNESSNIGLIVFPKKKEAALIIKTEIFDDLALRKNEIIKFHEFLYLLEYLKSNRYIYISKNDNFEKYNCYLIKEGLTIDNQKTTSQIAYFEENRCYLNTNHPFIYDENHEIVYKISHVFHLDDYTLIADNLFALIYTTEELRHLVYNNFVSESDKQNQFNKIAVWISIALSTIIGLLGLIVSIYALYKENDPIKINKIQFEKLVQQQQNESKQVKTLKPFLKKHK